MDWENPTIRLIVGQRLFNSGGVLDYLKGLFYTNNPEGVEEN
jgi:hypothetical protein